MAEYEALGAQAVHDEGAVLDIRYGPSPRETFDFFAAHGPARATLAYFHAGYWQKGDKSGVRFMAPAFAREGLHVALVNYPLCPTASLDEVLAATRRAIPAVAAHAGPALPLIAAGHSAGGQIVTELGLASGANGASVIAGVIALSGVFDLVPLLATSVNDSLGLDAAAAARHSPLNRVHAHAPPALFVVGGAETPAFVEQSRRMHEAWKGAGNRSRLHVEPGADHFSLLRPFSASGSILSGHVRELLARAGASGTA
jgi:arylformamidase